MQENQLDTEKLETAAPLPSESPSLETAAPLLETLVLPLPPPPCETFEEAGVVPEIMEQLRRIQWTAPTPIQARTLPHSLRGRDIAGFAQTGSGKTGAFAITLANFYLNAKAKDIPLTTFGLVITPTRELAMQIGDELTLLFAPLGLKNVVTVGGMDWDEQYKELQKTPAVIVATPGRLKDFISKDAFRFEDIQIFVCDEVDRMCDMGFIQDLELFLDKLAPTSQKLLFSATSSDAVDEVIFEYLNEPEYVSLNHEEITPERIEQHALMCEAPEKIKVLLYLLRQTQGQRSVVFTNTRLTAAWLHYKLRANQIPADIITGDLPQNKRVRLIKNLKAGNTNILIATDVASRGLHIPGITHVYNFDLPDEPSSYIHRIGRTARAGAQGKAYSLICDCYGENFVGIQELLGKSCPKPAWIANEWLQTPDHAGNPFSSQILRFDPQSKRGFEYDENWEQKKAQLEMEREQRARQPRPQPQESRRPQPTRSSTDPIEQSYQQRYQQELLRKQEKRSWWVRLVDKVLSFFRPKPKTAGRKSGSGQNRPPYGQDRNRPPYDRNANRNRDSYNREGARRDGNYPDSRGPRRDQGPQDRNRDRGGYRDSRRDGGRDQPRDGHRQGNRDNAPRHGSRDHNRPSHTHSNGSHSQRSHGSDSRGHAPLKKDET